MNIHDDIVVGGKDNGDHVQALEAIFLVVKDNILILSKKKCEFDKSSVKFCV